MAAELSRICFCIVALLFVTMASSANGTMPADNEILFAASSPSPYPELPESGGDSSLSSDASEYSPPPPPYIDALAAEIEAEQLNLSPDYSPSPAPYFTQYPSPPPYIEVEAPEVYELNTPTQAPAPEPSSVFGSDQSSDTEPGSPDSDMAPNPTVLSSNYRAEDENVEFDDEYYSSEQSKNRVTMVGFVLGAVCLVGLAGIVFNKKKYNKSKAEYDYELAKREDL
ncbi:extensin-like [Rosa sericea]